MWNPMQKPDFSISTMASPVQCTCLLLLLLLLNLHYLSSLSTVSASPELILEEGYTVSTLLDANKLTNPINPTSLSSTAPNNLLILDSPNSAFYTISFPISQDSEVKRLSGNGSVGFADGGLDSAMFDRPKSFAVDVKGNVYVADKTNHAIRKISNSGVTTIAGGHSGKSGKVDGPAQYSSFSEDFEVTFVQGACALLISDRGNRLIRQIKLKQSDCESASQWHLGASASVLLGVSCSILGSVLTLIVCFIIYPFISSREVLGKPRFHETWKHYQIYLERRVMTACSGIKSAVASSTTCSLVFRVARMWISHLCLMISVGRVEKKTPSKVSLLDSDVGDNVFVNQLKDLVSFDEGGVNLKQDAEDRVTSDVLGLGGVDAMIHANLMEFGNQSIGRNPWDGDGENRSNLVKRK